MAVKFPPVLIVPGPAPVDSGKTEPRCCDKCGDPYTDHSGDLCAICGEPVEHHDGARLSGEVEGCAELSRARLAAGLSLREFEEWCIARSDARARRAAG